VQDKNVKNKRIEYSGTLIGRRRRRRRVGGGE